MKNKLEAILILFALLFTWGCHKAQEGVVKPEYVIGIHGGAGNASNRDINE